MREWFSVSGGCAARQRGGPGGRPRGCGDRVGLRARPGISPEYALLQVNRVAAARGLPVSEVNDLVEAPIPGRTPGFIGQERVNVLELNLALAALPTDSTLGAGG